MRLPSLKILWQNLSQVMSRFPLQVILAVASTVIWWILIEADYDSQLNNQLGKLLLVANFAFTLLLANDVYAEAHYLSNLKKWIGRTIALLIAVGLFFLLDPWTYKVDIFRIGLLLLAFHLLVAFAPALGNSSLNTFWQYNKTLFLRFLTGSFYAAVLYAGLAIALFAIDELFNIKIGYQTYLGLFALVSAGFTTIFFLAGIPQNQELLTADSYPKGLKIFTQYVLIPLMTIYLVILLIYEMKILIEWTLPKGLVSILILGYAVFGILSLLLIYPIKDKEGNGWMRLFSKFFYLMMVPLIVLLFLAIGTRIDHYGITASRYILIVLALWLAGITIYFLFSKKQNIKIIPISLCILALLATYGPQSAFSIAKISQQARLRHLLKSKDKKEISQRASVVTYLVEQHGLISLQQFTSTDLQALELKMTSQLAKRKSSSYEIKRRTIDTAFSLLKVSNEYGAFNNQVTFNNSNQGVIDVRGYDVVVACNSYQQDQIPILEGKQIKWDQSANSTRAGQSKLSVTIGDELPVYFELGVLAEKAIQQYENDQLTKGNDQMYNYPSEKMMLTKITSNYKVSLIVNNMSMSYYMNSNDVDWLNFHGYLLIKKNK